MPYLIVIKCMFVTIMYFVFSKYFKKIIKKHLKDFKFNFKICLSTVPNEKKKKKKNNPCLNNPNLY
jgi:hypothetical protein